MVGDPIVAKYILRGNAKDYDKGVLAEILEPIMGQGLIPATAEVWNLAPETSRAAASPGITGKLQRARSRLYRSQILQVNMRWKALAEIYTMHSFAQLYNHIFFKKSANFSNCCNFLAKVLAFFNKKLRL